jgi:hypothetical protein
VPEQGVLPQDMGGGDGDGDEDGDEGGRYGVGDVSVSSTELELPLLLEQYTLLIDKLG